MKNIVLVFLLFFSFPAFSHFKNPEEKISNEEKILIIKDVKKLINTYYVSSEIAELVEKKLQIKNYNNVEYPINFSDKLTENLYQITHDKHIRVIYSKKSLSKNEIESISDFLKGLPVSRPEMNFGFNRVQRLTCNIGYLDFDFFAPVDISDRLFDSSMTFIRNTSALIIDLRKNIGGDPKTVSYFASYFFDKKPVHLNSIFWRNPRKIDKFYTDSAWPLWRYLNKNIYILTGKQTFSAAEEFAYDMQALRRGVIVGGKTGGGANPGHNFRINSHFSIFIPTGKAVNPITGKNWEGEGVYPDILVSEDRALETAYKLATKYKNNCAR